jgi:hypothetical protein
MPKPSRAAVLKVVRPLFVRKSLGTPTLARHEVDPKTALPKVVLQGAGGKVSLKNTPLLQNVFYSITVAEATYYLHYQHSKPNPREFDSGGESLDMFDGEGEIVGNGEIEGKREVQWNLHGF